MYSLSLQIGHGSNSINVLTNLTNREPRIRPILTSNNSITLKFTSHKLYKLEL